MTESQQILRTAVQAARKAGALLRAGFGKLRRSQISQKSEYDHVTSLDRRSERIIIRAIRQRFPRHAIQAEESGFSRGKGTLWVIDPLDGTSNYIHQLPLFGVSIGVLRDGALLAGVIYDPIHDELFTALRGKGAFLNGKRIRVSKVPDLRRAWLTTGIPLRARSRLKEYEKAFGRIARSGAGLRRSGSAALDLAYVASGRFDGLWEVDLSPWDIAAGALLVQEGGGRISDAWGSEDYFQTGDTVASNGRIHRELVKLTARSFKKRATDKTCRYD